MNSKCSHRLKVDPKNYDTYCTECFQIITECEISKHDDEIKRNHHYIPLFNKEYDRNKWNGFKLDFIRGEVNPELTDQTKLFIMEEIPDPFTWYDVAKVFLRYKLPDYWLGFGTWLGKEYKCPITPKIVALANQFTETKLGNYRVNYCYLIYKFVQIEYGHECRLVPMKGKAIWLYKMDKWWEEICKEKGYSFQVSVIYKLHWNKKERLSQFNKCIENLVK